MTWTTDPNNVWEKDWELRNPEPPITFKLYQDGKYHCGFQEMIAHVEWHQKRWHDFKKAFKEWAVP